MNAQELDFENNSFDYVLLWATLHHFYYADLNLVLQEALRVTKPNGYIIMIEPNILYPYNNLAYTLSHYLKKYFNIPYIEQTYTINERGLNPFKIIKYLDKKSLKTDLNFFDYHTKFSLMKDYPRPGYLGLLRKVMDYFTKRFLPEKYKYDIFSLKIKVSK